MHIFKHFEHSFCECFNFIFRRFWGTFIITKEFLNYIEILFKKFSWIYERNLSNLHKLSVMHGWLSDICFRTMDSLHWSYLLHNKIHFKPSFSLSLAFFVWTNVFYLSSFVPPSSRVLQNCFYMFLCFFFSLENTWVANRAQNRKRDKNWCFFLSFTFYVTS